VGFIIKIPLISGPSLFFLKKSDVIQESFPKTFYESNHFHSRVSKEFYHKKAQFFLFTVQLESCIHSFVSLSQKPAEKTHHKKILIIFPKIKNKRNRKVGKNVIFRKNFF
jgi:hypothetical protein